jgi:gamma-glutamylcyclotransferase (GGCT)/AIG2-like uncharacterized protein YtfP
MYREDMKKKFFVCGSLCKDMIHHHKFLNDAVFVANAIVKGSVYRLEVGYHAFMDEGESYIPGEVYDVEISEMLQALLDEFHGYSPLQPEKSLYLRKEIELITSDDEPVLAFSYTLNPLKLPKTAQLIRTGNWKDDFLNNPPLASKLTDKQKEYIKKLGQSTGREIVPIQLDIYRQLMNLGLIVDKGRRLALSKLGKEVLRFME